MKRCLIALVTLLALTLPGLTAAAVWHIDPDHSYLGFEVRKLMFTSVKGSFSRYTSTLDISEADLARSQVAVSIDTASIDTGNAKRDEHLRSVDYFDVARYPTMAFVAKRVVKVDDERFQVIGDLTLRGVTREVAVEVEDLSAPSQDPAGNLHRRAAVTARINRKDYGLAWNAVLEGGGAVVGNEVAIYIEVDMIKAASP